MLKSHKEKIQVKNYVCKRIFLLKLTYTHSHIISLLIYEYIHIKYPIRMLWVCVFYCAGKHVAYNTKLFFICGKFKHPHCRRKVVDSKRMNAYCVYVRSFYHNQRLHMPSALVYMCVLDARINVM